MMRELIIIDTCERQLRQKIRMWKLGFESRDTIKGILATRREAKRIIEHRQWLAEIQEQRFYEQARFA